MTKLDRAATDTTIPKVFHQIWWQGVGSIPPQLADWRQTWIRCHPDWDFIVWDADAMHAFVADHEPRRAAQFAAWPNPIFRADAFRYMLLKHRGGVYIDLDIECLRPIDEWIEGCEVLLSRTTGFNNCIIGGRPGHSLFDELVASIPDAAEEADAYRGSHSGPAFLTRIVKEHGYDARPDCRLAPPDIFEPLSPYLAENGALKITGRTAETCAIHHERLDWMPWHRRAWSKFTALTIMPVLRWVLNARSRDHE